MSAVDSGFAPNYGAGLSGTAVTASAVVDIDPQIQNGAGGATSFCITCKSYTNGFYVRTGKTSSVVATATDYYVLPGTKEILPKPADHRYMAIIRDGADAAYNVIAGNGD